MCLYESSRCSCIRSALVSFAIQRDHNCNTRCCCLCCLLQMYELFGKFGAIRQIRM